MRKLYEVWARPKKRGKSLVHFGTFPASRWQFAVKMAARLRRKGHPEVVVRELTVTHEHREKV
jgi:hypothetical protein